MSSDVIRGDSRGPLLTDPTGPFSMDRQVPKTADVPRAIPENYCNWGRTDEPPRSKYQIFFRALTICGVGERNQNIRLGAMEVGFLQEKALDYFQREVLDSKSSSEEEGDWLEAKFLPTEVRSLNETAFASLSFEYILWHYERM
jgi:hypothetical protein